MGQLNQEAVQIAEEALKGWEHSLAYDGLEAKTLWEKFAERAPDALTIKAMTLEADERRAERAKALRQYHRIEKALESTLGRSVRQDHENTRAQLVKQFARDRHPERLPERLQVQIVKHTQAQEKAQALERSRSRGRGLER